MKNLTYSLQELLTSQDAEVAHSIIGLLMLGETRH